MASQQSQQEENLDLYEPTEETVAPEPNARPPRDVAMGPMGANPVRTPQTPPVDLEPYKQKLRELYNRLTHDRESLSESLDENLQAETGELNMLDNHPADIGTEVFIRQRDFLLEDNIDDILRQCRRAMEKIEEGSYGFSDVSGQFIGAERLDALPYATLTVEEQERFVEG